MLPKAEFKDGYCVLHRKKGWGLIIVRNIEGVLQRKYYYDSVKKSKYSFSCHLQIDKKFNDVNKNRSKRKN